MLTLSLGVYVVMDILTGGGFTLTLSLIKREVVTDVFTLTLSLGVLPLVTDMLTGGRFSGGWHVMASPFIRSGVFSFTPTITLRSVSRALDVPDNHMDRPST